MTAEAMPELPADAQLLSADQIALKFFAGNVSGKWVRDNVPGKRTFGHRTVLWFAHEVREWLRRV